MKHRTGVSYGTTILAVRRNNEVAMAGDGQVTLGDTIMKARARKVRKVFNDSVLLGFAGATADAVTLFERFEAKLKEYNGDITRAAVELAKDWRTDRMLRRLEALLLVADASRTLLISGTGDVVEPDEGVIGIGSGGSYAFAAALAYLDSSELSPQQIAEKALGIAASICVYTNQEIIVESLT